MATRKKAKATRRARPKKAKAGKRAKAARSASAIRAAVAAKAKKRPMPTLAKRKVAKKRAASKPTKTFESVIVDTVEEPMPGVVVVTEYEGIVQRAKSAED
jgi:hypothetical protein